MIKKDFKNRRFLNYYIQNVIIIVLFLFISVILYFYTNYQTKLTSQIKYTEIISENLYNEFTFKIQLLTKMILIISNFSTVILDNHTDYKNELEFLYKKILNDFPDYYQVRYIDDRGKEIIRVVHEGDKYFAHSGNNLQNKSHRYYFQETVKLEVGQIFISQMDLNMENQEIEVPWIPTIRIATPIQQGWNHKKGIIIINIDVTNILSIFNGFNLSTYLLNSHGYYLAGEEKEKLWGFMFHNQQTLRRDNTEVWKQIQQKESGHIVLDNEIYTFKQVKYNAINNKVISKGDDLHWIILLKNVLNITNFDFINYFVIGLITFLLIIIASYFITKLRIRFIEAVIYKKNAVLAQIRSERTISLGRIVASVAHELNTPIGSSITLASTIKDETKKFESFINSGQIQKSVLSEYIRLIDSTSMHILNALENSSVLIQQFKLLSVDQVSERKRIFFLPDYLNNIINTLKPELKKKRIKINIINHQKIELDSYPGAFAQIIINLIQNSIIHGFEQKSNGLIKIVLKSDKKYLTLKFYDNGKGIADNLLPRIFDPFFSTAENIGGSGLGLHIVFNIVQELFKGTIEVESIVDEFTEFTIVIPLKLV